MNKKVLILAARTWLLALLVISPCSIFADVQIQDQLNKPEPTVTQQEREEPKPQPKEAKKESSSMLESDLAAKVIFTLFFSEILTVSTTDDEQRTLLEQFKPQALAKNFIHTYSSNFVATLAHELGHALAAKALNGDPIDVHLGANSNYTGKPMLKIGGICIDGFSPIRGYAKRSPIYKNEAENERIQKSIDQKGIELLQALTLNLSEEEVHEKICELMIVVKTRKINKPKNAIIALAGGASGIVAHFIMKSMIHLIKNSGSNDSLKEKVKKALLEGGLAIDDIYTHHIMNMLVPCTTAYKEELDSPSSKKQEFINLLKNLFEEDQKSDGSMFWEKCVGLPPSVMSAAEYAAIPIDYTVPCFVAHQEAKAAHKKGYQSSFISQCAIGLINQNLQGFLHFHV